MVGSSPNSQGTIQTNPVELMPTFQRPQIPEIQRKVKKAKIYPANSPRVPRLHDREKCLETAPSVPTVLISIIRHKWQNQWRAMKLEYKRPKTATIVSLPWEACAEIPQRVSLQRALLFCRSISFSWGALFPSGQRGSQGLLTLPGKEESAKPSPSGPHA